MTQLNFKKLGSRLIIIIIIFSAFTINSCRKESKPTQPAITDPIISQAKAWYESVYIANTKADNLLATRGITSAPNKPGITRAVITQKFDFTQHIKPDWKNAASYSMPGKAVIEIPVDPSVNFGSELKNKETNRTYSDKKYNRTSMLLIKSGKNYRAYLMVIMADSAYVKNDLKKISHNNYRHHDSDFSGSVFYFTPNGLFVASFTYKNGMPIIKPHSSTATSQPVQKGKVRAARLVRDYINCIDWYWVTYVNGVEVSEEYLDTTCDGSIPDGPGGGGLGGSDGSVVDGAFLTPGDNGIFGLNNSNAVVPDLNFDDLLNYVQAQQGLYISDPIDGPPVLVNGEYYNGQMTYIYTFDDSGNTVIISQYFSPDVDSGQFQTGFEYNLGNGTNSSEDIIFAGFDFGNPGMYLPAAPGSSTSQIITSLDVANASYVDDGRGGIDPTKYINCFNDGKPTSGYKLTIYVTQPIPGSEDVWSTDLNVTSPTPTGEIYMTAGGQILNVGHTFVGFEKDNTDGTSVKQVMGFYPGPGASIHPKGIIKDDSGHPYNVRYSINVSAGQFNAALSRLTQDYTSADYILSNLIGIERNCTDAAISWMTVGGASLPTASTLFFSNSPGHFGQALAKMNGASTTAGTAPQSHGPCP